MWCINPGFFFRITAVITLTGGTILLMWIGEQITSRGVGNGISLIIFAGIVARFPTIIGQALESARTGATNPLLLVVFAVFAVALVGCSSSSWSGPSAVCSSPIPSARSATRCYGGEFSHLPLKLNVSGVIPPIFASSILLLPTTVASFNAQNLPGWLQTHRHLYQPRPAALSGALCAADHLLRVLLHLDRLQSRRDGGESEEIWRRLPGHPARQEKRRNSSTIR